MATTDVRRLADMRTALATIERVELALRRYPDRDKAIACLEHSVAAQRTQLASDMRALILHHRRTAA